MSRIDLFREFTKELYEEYKRLGIKILSDYEFNAENSAQLISRIAFSKDNIHPLPYSIFKIHDELNFITKDIKYVAGMLHILRPYINDTYRDQGFYHQTLEDRRYLMYANFGLQSIYNYWDRLGDLLYLYFKTGLAADRVYFGMVMNNMDQTYKTSQHYIALNDLHNSKVKALFDSRHEAVHHFQLECKHYWGNVEFLNDLTKLKALNEEKWGYADIMKDQLSVCSEAFFLTMNLINELPNKPTQPPTA